MSALQAIGFKQFETEIVPDEQLEIQYALREAAMSCQAIFTTGGTGFSPRDVTPEATAPLLTRRADNLSELMRLKGAETTPLAYLSRGIAGMIGNTLVVNLPGSPKGARESIEAIAPLLPSILASLSGEGCPH